MSLFPAYAQDSNENKIEYAVEASGGEELLAWEAQLLASDGDEEREAAAASAAGVAPAQHAQPHLAQGSQADEQDYYVDCKLDFGNMRVSTIYYPGRPHYERARGAAEGAEGAAGARRWRRYYEARSPPDAAPPDAELAQRTRAFRDLLERSPGDDELWLQFIEFQEWCRDAEAALHAAEEAAARAPASERVRGALLALRARCLPPRRRLALLAGAGGGVRARLRVLLAAADAGEAELERALAGALGAARAEPALYPHALYVYGGWLRAAGLWERLVLLLELALAMNFPPGAFPPPDDEARRAAQDERLQHLEDKLIGSGLPLSTVWVRVERARAAAHWRPARGALPADPQRAPLPGDVAPLLQPAAPHAALLLLAALRLAKVPLLPAAHYAGDAAAPGADARGDALAAHGAEALLPLLRAARRLPPAHPARPAPAAARAAVLALADPPHYWSDDAGYLRWLTALWDAACAWTAGRARLALLCWRLRWLHALALLLDPQDEAGAREARRLRSEARAALKRFAGASPLPFAHFARLEQACGAPSAARRAALHAARAALRDPASATPAHERLYVARVADELCAGSPAGAWALLCAATARALPPDDELQAAPPRELWARALQACEARCEQLEREHGAREEDAREPDALAALLPAPAEWAAARARLCSPRRRAELVRALAQTRRPAGAAAARYAEQSACALVTSAAREQRLAQYARALQPLAPHNALLALASSGAPLWAWAAGGAARARLAALAAGAHSHVGALAAVLPALLRALPAWDARAADALRAACARAGRAGAGGALLQALLLEADARSSRPRPHDALVLALERAPHDKWLAVRGAAWCGAQAAALADVLLERGLRLHALLDELAPLLPERESSPRESPPRESPPRESPPRESPPRESHPRESPPRESPPRESPPRESPPRESPPRESPPRESHPRESHPRESPPRESPPRESPPRESSPVLLESRATDA